MEVWDGDGVGGGIEREGGSSLRYRHYDKIMEEKAIVLICRQRVPRNLDNPGGHCHCTHVGRYSTWSWRIRVIYTSCYINKGLIKRVWGWGGMGLYFMPAPTTMTTEQQQQQQQQQQSPWIIYRSRCLTYPPPKEKETW